MFGGRCFDRGMWRPAIACAAAHVHPSANLHTTAGAYAFPGQHLNTRSNRHTDTGQHTNTGVFSNPWACRNRHTGSYRDAPAYSSCCAVAYSHHSTDTCDRVHAGPDQHPNTCIHDWGRFTWSRPDYHRLGDGLRVHYR